MTASYILYVISRQSLCRLNIGVGCWAGCTVDLDQNLLKEMAKIFFDMDEKLPEIQMLDQ